MSAVAPVAGPVAGPGVGLSLGRRVAGQGAMVIGGGIVAQLAAFLRNAILAYGLAKGDFGAAMAILLALQLIEAVTDIAPERLIMQAEDGAGSGLMAAGHAISILRGFAAALLLFLGADWLAGFFAIAGAGDVFATMALVPLMKGFQHLDQRRAQRRLDNRAALAVELVPALVGLALALPLVRLVGSYEIIVWLGIAQAATQVAVSHVLASRAYRVSFDRAAFARFVRFGWPMLASAIPHAAAYHGERAIIGRFLGLEALAGYTVAFLITSAAGLITARLGQALVLPLLASARRSEAAFTRRYLQMLELHIVAATVFATVAIVGGNAILRVFFGTTYWPYGVVLAWLAVLWAIRIVQSVPALALMAIEETRVSLIATALRAAALGPAIVAAMAGARLETIVVVGIAGEIASLAAYLVALGRAYPTTGATMARLGFLAAGIVCAGLMPAMPGTLTGLALSASLAVAVAAIGAAVMPTLRGTVGRFGPALD